MIVSSMPHLTRDSAGTAITYSEEDTFVQPNDHTSALNSQQLAGAVLMPRRDDRWSSNSAPNTPILSRRSSAPQSGLADSYSNQGQSIGVNNMPKPEQLRERHSLSDLSQHQIDQASSVAKNGIQAKISNDSPVLAELKTNVIVKDEFTLVTDLTYHLAQRYDRAEGRILVKIDHSACLALGGAFDPCYVLTVSAVASHMQPAANKRNASAIQAFMADILSVSAERGIVKFDPIEASNLATAGQTISGMAEQLHRRRSEEYSANATVKRTNHNPTHRKHLNGGRAGSNVSEAPKQIPILTNGNHRPMSNLSVNNRHSRISEEAESDEDEAFEKSSPSPLNSLHQDDSQFRPQSSDGLRMNGVSNDAPSSRYNRMANGKPKMVGSRLIYTEKNDSFDDDTTTERPKHIPIDSTRGLTATATKTTMAKGTPRQVQTSSLKEQRTPRSSSRASSMGGSTFLDAAGAPMSPAKPGLGDGGPEKYNPKLDARAPERRASLGANGSMKRRSTITATPKVSPSPVLPPEPKEDLAYSIRETRSLRETTRSLLGKRKSFLKAFTKRQQQQAVSVANGTEV